MIGTTFPPFAFTIVLLQGTYITTVTSLAFEEQL